MTRERTRTTRSDEDEEATRTEQPSGTRKRDTWKPGLEMPMDHLHLWKAVLKFSSTLELYRSWYLLKSS